MTVRRAVTLTNILLAAAATPAGAAAARGKAPRAVVAVVRAGELMARVPVSYGAGTALLAAPHEIDVPAGARSRVAVRTSVPHELRGPLAQSAPVGEVSVAVGGHVVGASQLRTVAAVPAADLGQRLDWLLGRRSVAAALALLAGCSLTLAGRRRRLTGVARAAR